MLNYYTLPAEKRPYAQRGTKLLKEIRELEAQPQNGETKRKLKHLWKQFNEVFDFVFDNNQKGDMKK